MLDLKAMMRLPADELVSELVNIHKGKIMSMFVDRSNFEVLYISSKYRLELDRLEGSVVVKLHIHKGMTNLMRRSFSVEECQEISDRLKPIEVKKSKDIDPGIACIAEFMSSEWGWD